MPERMVKVYSSEEGTEFQVREADLRRVATSELGMVEGPFELNIFTKTILATAMQREQVQRNDALKEVMTDGGDWKLAMRNVQAVTELMEKFGIDDASWSPNGTNAVKDPPKPPEPVTAGAQSSLSLDGQQGMDI